MAFEQPLTNRAPPVLKLVQGAAITPIHHIYVDGVWLQVRVAAARAARAEAATGAPVLEVLEGGLHHTVPVPPRVLHRWVYNLVMCHPGNFQLANGLWVASLGYKMRPEPSSLPQDSPLSSSSMARWVPSHSKERFLALKRLVGPGSGMIRWWAEASFRDPSGTSQ